MLTSFFSKSNPINYLILGILIFASYFIVFFSETEMVLTAPIIGKRIGLGLIAVFAMLLLDFIIRKNHLTKNNTYGILFFTLFLLALPTVFSEGKLLVASIFILLSFRRILSFRSDKNSEKKILDASLWITLASFFYFWSLLFFIVLFVGLFRKPGDNYKEVLIPFVGFCALFTLGTVYYFITTDSFAWFFTWKPTISLDFSAYNQPQLLIPVAVLLTFLVWTGLWFFFKIARMQKKERPNAALIVLTLVVCMVMALASPEKTGAEVFLIISPLAIIITNYLENTKEFWFKEVLLWLAVLLPVLVFFLK
ncbi:DUF6427 family protein [Ulvibacter litoralis]|uniref:Uncharacterized protein n=1 Tax=Ulvibacter litoralis TaxID=227084 RepID=A0A1G7D7H5_9FLAO|nr:DUF6427 family protein [Ulvibacter litoralis]SDE47471.1 hypothetical protein SAMN05421855_101811 [Ulvibacter litoralis]